jgi:hypothetical protein
LPNELAELVTEDQTEFVQSRWRQVKSQ